MRTDPGKALGIAILFAAMLLATFGTLLATSFSVLDTDPASYIIVVMLMLFVFIVFSAKEELHLNRNKRTVVYGLAVFAAYFMILSYSRVALSFVFMTFRVDALLIPFLLVSMVLILFGTDGVRKLSPLVIYSFFLSPLLLMPLLMQNAAFANMNAAFVYDALKVFGVPGVALNGITITSAANTSISIATTCAPIGTFVALVMFLIPVAYLYEGGIRRKLAWVVSGLALLLLLNFGRMLFIAYSWAFSGISRAVAVFHIFAGQLLFYAAIIIMLLIAGRYGMRLAKMKKGQLAGLGAGMRRSAAGFGYPIAIVIAIGLIGLFLSLPYPHSVYASPSFFYGNASTISQNSLYAEIGGSFSAFSANAIKIGARNFTEALAILNASNVSYDTYVVASASNMPLSGFMVTNYSRLAGTRSYLLRSGIRITSATVYSGSSEFEVNYFAAPFNVSGDYLTVNYEFLKLLNGTTPSCSMLTYKSVGLVNYIESMIYNAVSGEPGGGANGVMCSAYIVANYV